MNKRFFSIFVILALACALALSAFAEEGAPGDAANPDMPAVMEEAPGPPAYYPLDVSIREDSGKLFVVKEYRVPTGVEVSELAETGMVLDGQAFSLWAVSRRQEDRTIEQASLVKSYDLAVPSNVPKEAEAALNPQIRYEEDGYSGVLDFQSVRCDSEMQEDGSYLATAVYSGTVTRVAEGALLYTLYYAPAGAAPAVVPQPETPTPEISVPAIPLPPVLVVAGVVLLMAAAAILLPGSKKGKASGGQHREKVKVYVPQNDIVMGPGAEDDPDD